MYVRTYLYLKTAGKILLLSLLLTAPHKQSDLWRALLGWCSKPGSVLNISSRWTERLGQICGIRSKSIFSLMDFFWLTNKTSPAFMKLLFLCIHCPWMEVCSDRRLIKLRAFNYIMAIMGPLIVLHSSGWQGLCLQYTLFIQWQ